MTTLQKFKLLATQCAVVGSPSRSPTTSPVVHLRRRRTLRMLLNRADRRRFPRREGSPEQDPGRQSPPENPARFRARHKLRDLFVSSSPPPPPLPPLDGAARPERRLEARERLLAEAGTGTGTGGGGGGFAARRGGAGGSIRPLSAAFRYRLLRRPWRPVLVAIPE
ncbi:uncharacterized protein LOC130140467 [Syzygium oleosum]|uniref:uncharacterized protein LOC130140467 n=1 Tax=Syzygium oleosum TaxID=219896 RepID=UPI0024BA1C15|nr:uncharacterized protein LOC130140467 [Syzygium oleosum]